MKSFKKIALGFILGVVCTLAALYFVAYTQNTEENQLREEIRMQSLKHMKKALDELEKE